VFEPTVSQLEGWRHIMLRLQVQDGFILADDTGLGKTLIALMVADELGGSDSRVLFITPAAVISAWIAHAAQSHREREVRSLCDTNVASSIECIASFMTGKHWLVVSYEYFSRHHLAFRKHGMARIALLVLDEAHFL
jgi:superfamily II DNA or RNA helicase